MVAGERVEIGTVVDLGPHVANMMISAGKARVHVPQPAPEPEPAPARRKSTPATD